MEYNWFEKILLWIEFTKIGYILSWFVSIFIWTAFITLIHEWTKEDINN